MSPCASLVPLIDITCFSDDKNASMYDKMKVAEEMRKACVAVGFFHVTSRSVSLSAVQEGFKAMKDLFDLPLSVKETANATNNPLYRGYQGIISTSHSCTPSSDSCTPNRDLKESFTIGAVGNDSPMHGDNQWPTGLSTNIQDSLISYWNTLMALALQVSKCLALSLGLEESFFLKKMINPIAQMVLLRYPPPSLSADGKPLRSGCGAHTDCGFLTLLVQDIGDEALQIQSKNGEWITVAQQDDAVLCNLGDMAERWSNNYYTSTWHRVMNLSRVRHSIPFFCNLDYDAVVDPLESVCQGLLKEFVGSPKFEPVKAGDYICQKLGLMLKGDQ